MGKEENKITALQQVYSNTNRNIQIILFTQFCLFHEITPSVEPDLANKKVNSTRVIKRRA